MVDTKDKKIEDKKSKEVKPEISQGGFAMSPEAANVNKSTGTKRKFINKKFDKKRGGKRGPGKPKSEFDQKIISLRRVTRVVAGGRRFSFSVAMVIGDRKGSVGVGLGKSSDTSLAIDKAIRDAKKNMITPALTKTNSIPFNIESKYCASRVMMVPAPGKGLKAGGAMRTILDLLGAQDVTGKIFSRSKNHINNARATIEALKQIGVKSQIKQVASRKRQVISEKNERALTT
jgi:small subunit ribosomal protein S5